MDQSSISSYTAIELSYLSSRQVALSTDPRRDKEIIKRIIVVLGSLHAKPGHELEVRRKSSILPRRTGSTHFKGIKLPHNNVSQVVPARPFIEWASKRLSAAHHPDVYTFSAVRDANELAGAPGSIAAQARATGIFPEGHYIQFPKSIIYGRVAPPLAKRIGSINVLDHAILLSTSIYLDFISLHPFYDGNGRVARLLAQRVLEDCGICKSTAAPFGAVFNRYTSDLIFGVLSWNKDRNIVPMWNVFHSALDELCHLSDCSC